MIFLEDQNRKYGLLSLDIICEYIPTMFQYGIFNLKMAMLLYEYNDLNLCKKLYAHMNSENSTFLKIHAEIMDLKIDFPFEIEEDSTTLLRNNSLSYNQPNKINIKIKKIYLKNSNLNEYDLAIIQKENDKLSIFNINGELIKQMDESYFEFNDITPNQIQINDIWTINTNEEDYIFEIFNE